MKPIGEMKKDELVEFALAEFGLEIDAARSVKELRIEVENLAGSKGKRPAEADAEVESTHLRHPKTGVVYAATPFLRARGDLMPCDAKGKAV